MAGPAEVRHDPPDGVERRLDGALGPRRNERDVVAGHEDAPLRRRQVMLHEVPVHTMVVAIVPRQGPLEGTEEVRVVLPRDRYRVTHDVASYVDVRVDLAEGVQREP